MKEYKIGDLVSVGLDSLRLPPFGTLGLVVDADRCSFSEETYYTIRFNDKETYLVYHNDLVKV